MPFRFCHPAFDDPMRRASMGNCQSGFMGKHGTGSFLSKQTIKEQSCKKGLPLFALQSSAAGSIFLLIILAAALPFSSLISAAFCRCLLLVNLSKRILIVSHVITSNRSSINWTWTVFSKRILGNYVKYSGYVLLKQTWHRNLTPFSTPPADMNFFTVCIKMSYANLRQIPLKRK